MWFFNLTFYKVCVLTQLPQRLKSTFIKNCCYHLAFWGHFLWENFQKKNVDFSPIFLGKLFHSKKKVKSFCTNFLYLFVWTLEGSSMYYHHLYVCTTDVHTSKMNFFLGPMIYCFSSGGYCPPNPHTRP